MGMGPPSRQRGITSVTTLIISNLNDTVSHSDVHVSGKCVDASSFSTVGKFSVYFIQVYASCILFTVIPMILMVTVAKVLCFFSCCNVVSKVQVTD